MFKYKSPLSRLLEGAGKQKEEPAEAEAPEAEAGDRPAPIADFNALRQALGGGDTSPDGYEENDELIPEEKMPDFDSSAEAAPQDDEGEDMSEHAQVDAEETSEAEEDSEDQIVTLHVTPAERVNVEEDVLAAVTIATAEPAPAEPEIEVAAELAEEEAPDPAADPEPEMVERAPELEMVEPAPEPEMTEPTPEPEAIEPAPEPDVAEIIPSPPAPAPSADRRTRVKTTFLGFERADTHVQNLMETAEPVAQSETTRQSFPVGWLVVTAGPGRGACITLTEGLMQIGRNDDQAIQLDFGDTGISRSNHAVVAYDPEDRKCYLGHGGKANLVRLNGKPVLSTVPLANGDMVRISETSIRFMAFCDDGFDWRDAD